MQPIDQNASPRRRAVLCFARGRNRPLRRLRSWLGLAFIWLIGGTPCFDVGNLTHSSARAQEAIDEEDGSGAPAPSGYQKLIDQAVKEFQLGNYPEAFSLFERAHAVQPNARTLRGMGLSAFEERRYVVCIEKLRAALNETRKPLTTQQRAHTEDVLQRALGFVAQYTLELSPANAQVTVDAQPPTIVEGILLLDPGPHEIAISVEGHQETRHVRARPNDNVTLRIKLTARQAPVTEQPAPWFSRRRKVGVAVASVGVAALATSLALTLKARSNRDEAGCEGGRCPDTSSRETYDRAVTLSRAATATVVVGGVASAAGLALVLWPGGGVEAAGSVREQQSHASARPVQVRLSPELMPQYAGISAAGSW